MPDVTTVQIARPDQAAMYASAKAALDIVESLDITSDTMYELAGEELVAIKKRAAALEEERKKITRPLDEAKRAVMDLFRSPLDLLTRAEAGIKKKMLEYSTERERQRAAEQAAREEAARAERERLAREAEALAAVGRGEEATIKREIASLVVAAPVEAEAPRAAGVSVRETWDFAVDDKMALIAYVAANPAYADVLTVNETVLRRLVLAMKEQLPLAGVRVFRSKGLAASRR